MALIVETLTRYDIDGLELDFLREPYLFSRGEEERGGAILNDWMAEIRQEVRRHEERRGHAIKLSARTPSRPKAGVAMGLDAVTWARQGLIDLLVVSPRWSTIEFDMPLRQWRQLLDGCDVTLLGGLEILLGVHPVAPKRVVTAEEARGVATQVLSDGADGVYLFNYFPIAADGGTPDDWRHDHYAETLKQLASLDGLALHPRSHVVTFCDITGPEGAEMFPPALPASGVDLEFHLPTGPVTDGSTASLTIDLARKDGEFTLPAATVNGVAAIGVETDSTDTRRRRLRYQIAPAALRGEEPNVIRLSTGGGPGVDVEHVEIRIVPPRANA
jgi:hypothetical protein